MLHQDWISECVLHDNPGKQVSYTAWQIIQFAEVTLIKRVRMEFVVYIESEYRSDRFGSVTINCDEKRIPVEEHYVREVDQEVPREGVRSDDLINM